MGSMARSVCIVDIPPFGGILIGSQLALDRSRPMQSGVESVGMVALLLSF